MKRARESESVEQINASWAIGVVLWLAATAAAAQVEATNDRLYVLPSEVPFEFTVDQLLENDEGGAVQVVYTQPVHGEVRRGELPGTLLYIPDEDFWILGMDSFTYTRKDRGARSAMVLMVAELHGRQTTMAGFESGGLGDISKVGDSIDVVQEAALDGAYGLRVEASDTPSFIIIDDDHGGGDTGSSSGGCETDLLAPPEGLERLLQGETVEVVSVGPDHGGVPGIRVLMKQEGEQLYIGAELPHHSSDVSWIGVDDGAHEILLDWWKPDDGIGGENTGDGMLLVIDDAVSQRFEDVGLDQVAMQQYRFGLLTVPAFQGVVVNFDNIVVRTGEATSVAAAPILVDSFEDGISRAWESDMAQDLIVEAAAAQTGSGGLAIPLGGVDNVTLLSDTPLGTEQYNVRFRLDPNSLKTPLPLTLLEVFGDAGGKGPLRARLLLKRQNGIYYLKAAAVGRGSTGWVSITNTSTAVELQWRAATSAAMGDGGLALWIDGSYVDEVAHLDNPADTVGSIRIGAAGAHRGEGVLYLDDFESWMTAADFVEILRP